MEAVEARVKNLEINLSKVEVKVERLERKDAKDDVAKVTDKIELKEIMLEAVREGVSPLQENILKIENRVKVLEDKDKDKVYNDSLEKERNGKAMKRDVVKQILMVSISVVVTFLVTAGLTGTLNAEMKNEIDKLKEDNELNENVINYYTCQLASRTNGGTGAECKMKGVTP